MTEVARRQSGLLPDLLDWLEAPWGALLPMTAGRGFRVEECVKDDHYVVRAELPGMDPAKDVEVRVDERSLTIHAERREELKEPHRSEFRYGSFTRSLPLPAHADTGHITATYDKGILEVIVLVPKAKPAAHRVEITQAR